MDIKKVLQKINLILSIEDHHGLQGMFENILSYYQSNDPENLDNQKVSLKSAIEESEINNFIQSDFSILEGLGIRGYFDTESLDYLEEMLISPGYTIQNKITDFVNKRAELLQHIRQLKSSVEAFGLHEETTQKTYQIALSLPTEYRDLGEMEKILKDTKTLLQEINSKFPESAPPKIVSVNNGSIELFIEVGKDLALHIYNIIGHIVTIYAFIKAYKDAQKGYDSYKLERKREMDKIAKEELEDRKKELLDDIVKELPLENEEERTRATSLIVVFIDKHIEKGVHLEIKPPILEEPERISDNDSEEIKKQKQIAINAFEQKKLIDTKNKELFSAQKEGIRLELPNPQKDENSDK